MHITKQRSMLFLLTLSKQIDHCKVYSLISKSRTGLSSTFSTSAIFQQETDVNPGDSVYGKTSKPIKLRRMDLSPWAPENNRADPNRGRSKNRYRQHVNPLSRKFQVPTELAEEWPNDGTFTDPFLPLHIDIGCGKGGFLLSMASKAQKERDDDESVMRSNYLGLEIRPSVVQFAKDRIYKRKLTGLVDFIGCNANYDLDRILRKYTVGGTISLVSIQFPDPHFKHQHRKRRVVTPELVLILSKHIPENGDVFIQSDVKEVFDRMRLTFREAGEDYFIDMVDNVTEYMEMNPIGIPTEREIAVFDQGLPVYRTIFRRNSVKI